MYELTNFMLEPLVPDKELSEGIRYAGSVLRAGKPLPDVSGANLKVRMGAEVERESVLNKSREVVAQDAIHAHILQTGDIGVESYAKRQQRRGLWNYLLSEYDMGALAATHQRYGNVQNLQHPFGDPEDKYNDIARAWARNEGYGCNPEQYWLRQGKAVPGGKSWNGLFSMMGDDLARQAKEAWDAYSAKKNEILQMPQETREKVIRIVNGDEELSARNAGLIAHFMGADTLMKVARVARVLSNMRDSAQQQAVNVENYDDWLSEVCLDPKTGEVDGQAVKLVVAALKTWAERTSESGEVGVLQSYANGFIKRLNDLGELPEDTELARQHEMLKDKVKFASKQYTYASEKDVPKTFIGPTANVYDEQKEKKAKDELTAFERDVWMPHIRRRAMRGRLRTAVEEAEKYSDTGNWWQDAFVGTLKPAASMVSDTAPYFIPYIGPYAGFVSNYAGTATGETNKLLAGGEGYGEARLRGLQTGVIEAAVEAIPGSRLGSVGLNKLAAMAMRGGKPGVFTRAVAKVSSKGFWPAFGVEFAGGMFEEGLVEPLVGGVLTMGTDALIDSVDKLVKANGGMGVPHLQRRSWGEAFEELKNIWTDPRQAAALMLFTAGLNGVHYGGIKRYSEHFAKSQAALEAVGLTEEHAQEAVYSDNPFETAQRLLKYEGEQDPEGLALRRRQAREKAEIAEGVALAMTGLTTAGIEAEARAAGYDDLVERGLMPRVEKSGERDGKSYYRITTYKPWSGMKEVESEQEFGESEADAVLKAAVVNANAKLNLFQQSVFEQYADSVEKLAGEALGRELETKGAAVGLQEQDLGARSDVGGRIRKEGALTKDIAEDMENQTPSEDWKAVARAFVERIKIMVKKAKQMGKGKVNEAFVGTTAMRNRSDKTFRKDGRDILGSIIYRVRGMNTPLHVLEEVTESFADQGLQVRMAQLVEEGMDAAAAEEKALSELAGKVREAQKIVNKLTPGKKHLVELPMGADKLNVIEAMSDLSRARAVFSPMMPEGMQSLQQFLAGVIGETNEALQVAEAYKKALQENPELVQPLEDFFSGMDMPVRTLFSQARVDAEVKARVMQARAWMHADTHGVNGTGAVSADEAIEAAEETENGIAEREAEHQSTALPEATDEQDAEAQKQEAQDLQNHLERMPQAAAPSGMKGVFVGDACIYNQAGGYYSGNVLVTQLRDSADVKQVKAGTKGKHGVINPIVGEYQQTAPSIYVWRRKDGTLEVISGRHRFALAIETNTESIPCYVFNEDETHNLTWARMLDYENNMMDDQADELTAALYIRETGYSDATLTRKGLTRDKSRSKRGIFIGREAREELWTRFKNGKVSPKDAEIICNMTRGITDQKRVDEIQRRCCMLLDQKKSWDYIGAMVQLMANKESVRWSQDLLDLGADFEADMQKAATYIEKNVQKLRESIDLLKQNEKLGGKKRKQAERLGIHAGQAESAHEHLSDLVTMLEMFNNIGAYPDLIASARLWDGKTEVDPVGMALTIGKENRGQAERENAMSREDWENEQARKAAQDDATGSLFGGSFSITIPRDRICRTRAEARAMVGRKGEPLHLENRFLNLDAVFNSKSEGKFNDGDSIGRSIAMLTADGLSVDEAKTAHYTAYGNIAELFANGERMEFERAYKKKDVRKGFLHVYSPFYIEGRAGEYESNIELEIHQMPGQKPTAYLLNVYIQKRKPAIESGDVHNEPLSHAVPTSSVEEIEADFPGIVKDYPHNRGRIVPAVDEGPGNVSFSVIGPHAKTWGKYKGKAFAGRDDGMQRAEIDASKARLRMVSASGGIAKLTQFVKERRADAGQGRKEEYRRLDARLEELDARMDAAGDKGFDAALKDFMRVSDSKQAFDLQELAAWRRAFPELEGLLDERYADLLSQAVYGEGGAAQDALSRLGAELQSADKAYGITPVGRALHPKPGKSREEMEGSLEKLLESAVAQQFKAVCERIEGGERTEAMREKAEGLLDKLRDEAGRLGVPERLLRRRAWFQAYSVLFGHSAVGLASGLAEKVLLEDVLDYPELFAAYPQLKDIGVYSGYSARYGGAYNGYDIYLNEMLSEEQALGVLLHEVQHAIQRIEGFAAGGNLKDYEAYSRLAGEIEARNVQTRRTMTAGQREAVPFNGTLEYPGGATFSTVNLDDYFLPLQEGEADVPIDKLYTLKKEPRKSVDNARRFMRMAVNGKMAKRGAVAVALAGDGSYTVVDGNATCLALAGLGAKAVRVKVVGKDTGSRLNNSAYLVKNEMPGADADGELRTHGLDGLAGDAAVQRAFEQAEENLSTLGKLVAAAAAKVGGQKMMRPANSENGLATKKPSTVVDKAERDYEGDISCVVDLIGGTVVMPGDGDFGDAIKAVKKALPEGASIARVKKLGFQDTAPRYKDVKVSVRFANGGIGEIILVEKFVNKAKFNRGGHAVYEVIRELDPYAKTMPDVEEAKNKLDALSSLVYAPGVDAAALERAKSLASKALEFLQPSLKNLALTSGVIGMIKSPSSLSKVIIPDSVDSAATPRTSLIQNISGSPIPRIDGESKHISQQLEEKSTGAGNGDITFSMLGMTARAKVMMQPRGDEVEAKDIAKRWGWWLGQLERVNAAKGDKKLGSGVARYGTLITLLEATRGVLPPALAGMGRLNKLMEWAAVYAGMVETGEIPARKGVLLKGDIVEKFVAKLQQKRDETLRLGMSEEEAREVIAELGAEKLEQALAKVAKECRARLDMLLKVRAYERIGTAAQRAYPKKERGKKSPRGKMDSRHYREMQTMLNWMGRDANDVARRTKAIRAQLDALDGNAEDYAERRDSLEHELKVVTTYGNWKGMGAMQAVNASLDFARFVAESRHVWDRKAEDEKARLEWYRRQISRNFKKGNNAEERRKAKQEGGALKVSLKGLKGSGYGTMSFIQLIYSAKRVWGEGFRRKICAEVADATAGMTNRRKLANNAVYQAFRAATGKKGEREFLSWFNEFNKLSDSGLKLRNTRRYTIEMDRGEARQWVRMSKDERQARRREVSAEEEMEKMVKHKLPPEQAIPKLIRILDEMDARDKARWEKRKDKEKPMKVAGKVKFSEFYDKGDYMLRISKNAAANALLLLQQEDYKHLIENEGFVPIDAEGYIIDRSKDPDTPIDVEKTLKPLRDFIGEEGVAFAYALQRYVLLNGKDMQRVYEERMGVPLAMKDDYWRGNFDLATLKETDDLTQLNGGGLDGGGAYGFLIDRVRHYSHLDWNNTLTQVFNITVETQNNYVLMSGISYELRRLLADKDFAEGLQVELGVDYMNALKKWINLIEGAQKSPGFMSRWAQRVFQNSKTAMALAALSGNVSVLVKQWSAIIHGMLRTDVVSGVKVSEAGVREFAYKNIGMADYVAGFARTLARQNVPLLEDILNSEWWQAREDDKAKFVADALLRPSGKKWSQAGKLARVGMDVIEWNDRMANLVSMVATADCVYRHYAKVGKANKLNMSEREMRRLAVEEVGRTLAAVAQPKETVAKSLWGAQGGVVPGVLLAFKSEALNKLGNFLSQAYAGEFGRGLAGFAAFGFFNALVAWGLEAFWHGGDDKSKEPEWWRRAVSLGYNSLLADLGAVPVVSDVVKEGDALILGRRSYLGQWYEGMLPVGDMKRRTKRLYTGKKNRKAMTAYEYMDDIVALVKGAAVTLAPFSYGTTLHEILLSAAAAGNAAKAPVKAVVHATE